MLNITCKPELDLRRLLGESVRKLNQAETRESRNFSLPRG